jgi:uncharacterized membrane protein
VHFAALPPAWIVALVAAGVGLVAYAAYQRPLAPLSGRQRAVLMFLRGAVLAAIVGLLWRPVRLLPPSDADAVIPILVDTSRSMRVVDHGDQSGDGSRLERTVDALQRQLIPALTSRFRPEIYAIGEGLTPAAIDRLGAHARHSDLSGALDAVRERFKGRRLTGVVLLSDGGDTGQHADDEGSAAGPAIFTVGVGVASGLRDREVVGITAGDPRLDQAAVDLQVTVMSSGYGRDPFEVRLRANGDLVDTRRVTPEADGSPITDVFNVSPDPLTPTVYTVEIDPTGGEPVVENNRRTLLVSPAARKRRVLMLQGAPGFEHSFLTRTLSRDPGLELDIVVRKGQNETGQHTFFVQAPPDRAPSLMQGFPPTREALYRYDAVVVANIEGDFFTRAQHEAIAEFTGKRGGGVLVMGGQSFGQKGLIGTALEEVLPVELNDRRRPMSRAEVGNVAVRRDAVTVTPDGERHPVMRLGTSAEEVRGRWAGLPALTATTPLGGPRPGASVLAVTASPSGVTPVVAVQRYGAGRSMVFAGEASWRWRMLLPAGDRSYDRFWRQAVRWLAGPAPDPVAITIPDGLEPGDTATIAIDARSDTFEPAADAAVRATLTAPGGAAEDLVLKRDGSVSGRFAASWRPEQPGLYRLQAEATRGRTKLGTADRWVYVGGTDREFTDPRLNEGVLRRIAQESGGDYLPLDRISALPPTLAEAAPTSGQPEPHDIWDRTWVMVLIFGTLSAEWILRRRWGLR